MDKEVQGIERGKCACGECEDFMRSAQMEQLVVIVAVCRLAVLKRMHTTPLTVCGTSAAGTSESVSPEKWKDEDLGWFPNPKGEYTEFSNSILPKVYLSF